MLCQERRQGGAALRKFLRKILKKKIEEVFEIQVGGKPLCKICDKKFGQFGKIWEFGKFGKVHIKNS